MKIWLGYASSHSLGCHLHGTFKTAEDAKAALEMFARLVDAYDTRGSVEEAIAAVSDFGLTHLVEDLARNFPALDTYGDGPLKAEIEGDGDVAPLKLKVKLGTDQRDAPAELFILYVRELLLRLGAVEVDMWMESG